MRPLALALPLLALPALVHAGDVWRWQDEHGTTHYTNVADRAPAGAAVLDTRIILEVDHLPGAPAAGPDLVLADGAVVDAGEHRAGHTRRAARSHVDPAPRPRGFVPLPDPPRIYDEARLDFACFSAGVLHFGGFSHSEDIAPVLNCHVYRLGPRAWLNAARAELAVREHGIDPRDLLSLYLAERRRPPHPLDVVSETAALAP